MAVSCGDDPSHQRIVDAFRAHYDDLVEATTVCTGKVARVLYQEKVIGLETMKDASEVGVGKLRGSVSVVDAVFTYIKSWKSLPKSQEVLSILEKHDPSLKGVVATIRKEASSASRNTSSDKSVSFSDDEDEGFNNSSPRNRLRLQRLSVTHRFSGEFTKLMWRFGTLKRKAKRLIIEKPVEFPTLKDQLLQTYSEEEDTCDAVYRTSNVEELLNKVVLPRCTLTNYFLLVALATELRVPEILSEIDDFEKCEERLEANLLNEDFAVAMNNEIARRESMCNYDRPRTEIKLKVAWEKNEATLNEYRNLMQKVFPALYKHIDLEVTREGCVCFICYAPYHLEAALVQMAREQIQAAQELRVTTLTVGATCIFHLDDPSSDQDNRNDEAEHVPEEPNHQPQQQPQQLHQHSEAYGLHREEMHAMKEELAREKREMKYDFARKERELKGELAERVTKMKAEMANNKKEMKEEMEKKENAMAQREKELKDEMAEKEKHMKDELNKKDTEFIQLREKVAASGTYWTLSLILFVILIASLGVIANRHLELNSALERNLKLTSEVQTLIEYNGRASVTEQLYELKECHIKLQELLKIEGKCLVFEENLRGNSSLALVKQTDFLMKEMEKFKDCSAKDVERKDKCDQHLQHVQNQLSMIMKNATALILEKEEWKNKYQKCKELSTNQENS